jgi:extracellular elastinolytic metalloproteinase
MSLANVASSTPTVSLEDAIASAEQTIDGTFNEHPPTLEFLPLEVGSVRLTHVMQIQNAETNAWLEAFVDAHTGDVLSLTDFVTKTSVCPAFSTPMPAELIGGFVDSIFSSPPRRRS